MLCDLELCLSFHQISSASVERMRLLWLSLPSVNYDQKYSTTPAELELVCCYNDVFLVVCSYTSTPICCVCLFLKNFLVQIFCIAWFKWTGSLWSFGWKLKCYQGKMLSLPVLTLAPHPTRLAFTSPNWQKRLLHEVHFHHQLFFLHP